jgi:hypothetical protein
MLSHSAGNMEWTTCRKRSAPENTPIRDVIQFLDDMKVRQEGLLQGKANVPRCPAASGYDLFLRIGYPQAENHASSLPQEGNIPTISRIGSPQIKSRLQITEHCVGAAGKPRQNKTPASSLHHLLYTGGGGTSLLPYIGEERGAMLIVE